MNEHDPLSRLAVIINPASGSVEAANLKTQLTEGFRARGLKPEMHICPEGSEIHLLARQSVRRGVRTVVAAGGDGTVSAVAAVLADTDATLGILPVGTLNHFAKDVGVPLDLDQAIATIVEGDVAVVDVGEVNGRTFINNSSLGLYPRIVRHREAQQRLGRSKWWALSRGVLAVLGRYSFLQVQISSPEEQMVRDTPFVFIGNNEYEIHGLNIGTRSRIDTGKLSVYLTRRIDRAGLLGLVIRGICGRLRDFEDFDTFSTERLQVQLSGPAVGVALDGEIIRMTSPLRYRCRQGALRVLVKKKDTR